MHPVLLGHQARLQELQTALASEQARQALASVALASAVAVAAFLAWMAIARAAVPRWSPLAPVPFAAAFTELRGRRARASSRLHRLCRLHGRAIDRLEDRWAGLGESGAEFVEPGHPYAADLGLAGPGGLFERLCTARTHVGKQRLAEYLLRKAPAGEIAARQEAVRELRDRGDLRETLALLGGADFDDAEQRTFAAWLDAPVVRFPKALRAALAASSVALLFLLLSWITGAAARARVIPAAGAIAVLHAAAGLALRTRVRRVLDQAPALPAELRLIREGLAVLASESPRSPKLRALAECARGAGSVIRPLERWLTVRAERTKDSFYGFSLLFLAGTHCAMAIEAWREVNRGRLRVWFDAWAEFEALNAIACYAHERPGDCWPELAESPVYEASAIAHPLLPAAAAVRNDVALRPGLGLCIVSGSNMSGKSTLLRAVGVNAALAFAGAPVRATRLRLAPFTLWASIHTGDSLREGKSRFLAEVERLREMLDAARESAPVLFLIDEIFSGTNSRDRRAAAEAVLRELNARGAVGMVTTHDLTLTEIAREGTDGYNVHMGSGGSGPLDFDYRVKPGPSAESNALAIARLAGVAV